MRPLVRLVETEAPHLTTLALGSIRKHDPAAAAAVYQGLQIPWERVASAQRAVHAAALGGSGRVEEARREVAALPWEELCPEERELIKQWRTP